MTNSEQRQGISAAQRRAIAALLTERDVRSAAAAAKVGEATLHRWLRGDDNFVAALRKAEADIIDNVTRSLLRVTEGAMGVIVGIAGDTKSSPNTRLRAAGMLLDHFLRLRELRNTEARLEKLENAIQEMGVKL